MAKEGKAALPEKEIRMRAYFIWEAEGRPNGRDADHWLRAQTQLENEAREDVRRAKPATATRPRAPRKRVDESSGAKRSH